LSIRPPVFDRDSATLDPAELGGKSCIEFIFCAGVEDVEFDPQRARRRECTLRFDLRTRIGWIQQIGKAIPSAMGFNSFVNSIRFAPSVAAGVDVHEIERHRRAYEVSHAEG